MAYEPSQSEIDQYGYVRAKIRANNNPRRRGSSSASNKVIAAFMREYKDIVTDLDVNPLDLPTFRVRQVAKNIYKIGLLPVYDNGEFSEGGYYFTMGIKPLEAEEGYAYTEFYRSSQANLYDLIEELETDPELETSLSYIVRSTLVSLMNVWT